ncbi:MAG: amino acid ABC transporter permease [Proteobacteria bacterium]|nr:amino acid ABC transporter permease [Pseudomonadota bacterium]
MEFASSYGWAFFIIQGTVITLQYAVLPLILGLIIGIILAMMKQAGNPILTLTANAYISIIRGTPLLLQLYIMYFAFPGITGYKISAFAAGIIAFSCNSAAYIAEIIRAGIGAVDKGQFEAAHALHIPYYRTMLDIILPQAMRNILPSLVNEAISLVKESAIVAIIGEGDLMRRAQMVAAEQYNYLGPLLVAAVCYYMLIVILSHIGKRIERSLNAKY